MTDEDELRHVLKAAPPDFDSVPVSALQNRRLNRTPLRRVIAIAGAVVLALAIAGGVAFLSRGSSNGGGPASAPTYNAADRASQNRFARSAPCRHLPRHPRDAAAVANFTTVAVVNCRVAERSYPGQGEWEVMISQLATVGVPQLLSALVRPDEPSSPGACSAVGYLPPQFVLANPSGHYLRPRFPETGCGEPQPAYRRALEQVVWRDVAVARIRQTRSATSVRSGCAQEWKNENSIEDSIGTAPSPAGPVFGSEPAGALKVCIYRQAADPVGGNLVRSVSLSGADAEALRTALSGAGPMQSCQSQPDYAVVFAGHQYVNVELGGCWRVLRQDGRHTTIGTADAQQLGRLLHLH